MGQVGCIVTRYLLTLCVQSVGAYAQRDGCVVALVRIKHVLRKLGCLAQTNRKHTGSQRIETSSVTRLCRLEQSLGLLQCPIRGHARGFIENENATDSAAFPAPCHESVSLGATR